MNALHPQPTHVSPAGRPGDIFAALKAAGGRQVASMPRGGHAVRVRVRQALGLSVG
ncbi:MAG: hypothetical protein J0H01_02280 [Rhizobiales bacterium]|nr:hypothetical protein [Hyphomicrobiales bacterium]